MYIDQSTATVEVAAQSTASASAPVPAQPTVAAYLLAVRRDLPDWLGKALVNTLERLDRARQGARGAAERVALGEAWASLQTQRNTWLQRLVHALQQAIDDDLAPVSAGPRGAGPGPELTLSLLADDTIDEDIALSRLVQAAEAEADTALRELAARCSRIRGLANVSPDANPMRPAVVAGALRRAVAEFGLPPTQRVAMLREMGAAIGSRLAAVYAVQLELLTGWGVEPTRFKLRLSLGEGTDAPRPLKAAAGAAPRSAAAPAAIAADALRRLGVGQPGLSSEPAADVMARLLSVLVSRAALTDGARKMIRRLDGPARRLATQEPEIWRLPEHPLWLLLDRLVSAGSVHETFDATRPGALGAALEQAVRRLEDANPPDAAHCQAALAAVDFVVTDLVDEQSDRVAPQAEVMQDKLARKDIEARLREQVVQQVRASAAPAALRQFLVGPWASALAHSAHHHGSHSVQVRAQAELVDDLISTCCRAPGSPLSVKQFTRFMTHARLGLDAAGFVPARVEAELADLEQVLRAPWEAPAAKAGQSTPGAAADVPSLSCLDTDLDSLPFALTETMESAPELGLHEALPTVPIAMLDDDGSELPPSAHRTTQIWLDSLEPGALCRMFMLERWMNTQLVWRSLNRTMFIFSSRHGGRTHSLSRRALEKLRAAGLAATIERGQFIAQALGELAGNDAG